MRITSACIRFAQISLFPLFLAFYFVNLAISSAVAASVSPMQLELGVAERQQITLENDGSKPITVETGVFRRSFNEIGEQHLEPSDADFLIFPPLAVIQPGKTQAFQLQHVGPIPTTSQSYYVKLKQLPVDVDPVETQGGRLKFLFAFNVAVNLVPPGAEPALSIEKIKQGGDEVEIIFANSGSRYFYLRDLDVHFNIDGKSLPLDGAGTQALAEQNVVVPGDRRRVILPLPAGVTGNVTDVLAKLK